MLLRMPVRTLLITLAVISVACKEDMPINHPHLVDFSKCIDVSKCVLNQPCMVDISSCLVYRYVLNDPSAITYQFDTQVPLISIDKGYCFPEGELEAVLAWARQEQKSCTQAQIKALKK